MKIIMNHIAAALLLVMLVVQQSYAMHIGLPEEVEEMQAAQEERAMQELNTSIGGIANSTLYASVAVGSAIISMKTEFLSECSYYKFLGIAGSAFAGLSGTALYRIWQWAKYNKSILSAAQRKNINQLTLTTYATLASGALAMLSGYYLYQDSFCSQLT